MTKVFTVAAGHSTAGIPVHEDGTVHVGEPGRGRVLVRVPPPAGAEIRDGRLVSVPGEGAVILIRDHSGFRGGWSLHGAETPAERAARAAALRSATAEKEIAIAGVEAARVAVDAAGEDRHEPGLLADAWRAALEFSSKAVDRQTALARPPQLPLPAGITVIAQGACVQGDAGRAGGGPEYLLRLPPGMAVVVRAYGRRPTPPTRIEVSPSGEVSAVNMTDEATSLAAGGAW